MRNWGCSLIALNANGAIHPFKAEAMLCFVNVGADVPVTVTLAFYESGKAVGAVRTLPYTIVAGGSQTSFAHKLDECTAGAHR
jgi:hypothetical protein